MLFYREVTAQKLAGRKFTFPNNPYLCGLLNHRHPPGQPWRMKSDQAYFIFDFDSTFTQVEALDVLCEIALADRPNRDEILDEVQRITNTCMEGNISFRESLQSRLALLPAHRDHLPVLIDRLRNSVSPSFRHNRAFFSTYASHIYVVSNGFREFIVPIVEDYGISEDHVFANSFTFDEEGNITGFDHNNALSTDNGKAMRSCVV